jgi:geranylgeranyl diphosphate synthase type II
MKTEIALTLEQQFSQYQSRTEQSLEQWLPTANVIPSHLHEAMRYACLNGGKRVRPALVYMTGEALGIPLDKLDGPACALELIHVYSLVHDDLPAMDDDDLRRGKPTTHIAFDEATAILVGDALQSLAFYILAHDPTMIEDHEQRLRMVEELAMASGSRGMAGGQAMDLAAAGKQLTLAELEDMHIHKTGALIRAGVRLGAMSAVQAEAEVIDSLDHFAKCMGLAFQIQDDILDVEGNTETLGKTQGADQAQNKITYPALVGLAESKRMAHDLHQEALQSLAPLGEKANGLRALASYIIERQS